MEKINDLYKVIKIEKKVEVKRLSRDCYPKKEEIIASLSGTITEDPFASLPFENEIKEIISSLDEGSYTLQRIVNEADKVCYEIIKTTQIIIEYAE